MARNVAGELLAVAVACILARLIGPALQRRVAPGFARLRLPHAMSEMVPWALLALLLLFARMGFARAGAEFVLLRLALSLTLAWVVIRLASGLVRDRRVARAVAVAAWLVAALNIAGLLESTLDLLDAMAVTVGTLRLSVLLIGKALLVLAGALWTANLLSRIAEQRLSRLDELTPSMQVLASKLTRAGLLTLAVVLALGTVGIDLTAFAVFSGAIGVGLGFGLQKVVSNLISGVILLLDDSIKPGDVIQLGETYGWITRLNARYASVRTRDGTEYLIPNEDLITQRVVNWTYSNDTVRLHVAFGIAYDSDVHAAMALAVAAAAGADRVLADPHPICLMTGFGDSSVDFELRFWINDPRAGTANVRSAVMIQLWDRFKQAGIEFPFPQRDLHLRTPLPPAEQAAGQAAGPR